MALFFDSLWFDARLAALGLRRSDVAAALGLSGDDIGELWKDQRELTARDVRLLAALLGVTGAEIASRAGIATPVPQEPPQNTEQRLARIEAELGEIKRLLLTLTERGA